MQTWILKDFFAQHGAIPRDAFLTTFTGAFLLSRFHDEPPLVIFLERDKEFSILFGSDEDCDVDFVADPTMDAQHCRVAYHAGFQGWTVEDLGSSFGTLLDENRLAPQRPTLLSDRSVVKVGGGLLQLQFYEAATLADRIRSSGVTRSLKRKKGDDD
ncbi:MAG: FHA domain-containing protein [Planctomycetota bacterium]